MLHRSSLPPDCAKVDTSNSNPIHRILAFLVKSTQTQSPKICELGITSVNDEDFTILSVRDPLTLGFNIYDEK